MEVFQRRLADLIRNNPEFDSLKQMFALNKTEAWFVGGCLRDFILNLPVVDVDIAVEKDPTPFAKKWANECQGRWFWLDADRLQSRVLLPNHLVVDFSPLRASKVSGDQKLRDFTINSFAFPIVSVISKDSLLDPLNGLEDLEQRTIKFCSSQSIADDPLRMLKGVRHAVTLQMKLSDEALQQIRDEAPALQSVAGERIRDELGKILTADSPATAFELLLETGLLKQIFGPAGENWDAHLAFNNLQTLDRNIYEYAATDDAEPAVDRPYNSRALYLLATFLHHYQPDNLVDLLHSKLRLSRQQQRIILSLQTEPSPEWLGSIPRATTVRQKALLVETLGHFPAEQLIYWSIYKRVISRKIIAELLMAYQQIQKMGRIPDLLDGHHLEELIQPQGKEIGVWLKRIKQAEIQGIIDDSASASAWLKSKISD